MINETALCKLALKYKTDKCPKRGKHTYTPFYYSLLKNKKKSIKKVLEIGIGKGASLYMWRDFFPNAKIYGVDYRQDLLINKGRIESILCDQRRKEHLKNLIDIIGTDIDLVIDDGSHRPRDQVFTCLTLIPQLNKGVTYVIEDVADPSIVERFSQYDVKIPKIDQSVKRYDNRLVIVRHKSTPSKEIIFYTDNQLNPRIANLVQAQLGKISANLKIPIISSSLKPMPYFGTTNIHFPNFKRGHRAMFKQTLAALEKCTADIIFFCEHDVLYHPSHFAFIPPKKDKYYYNQNWWMLRLTDGHAVRYDACKLSTLSAYRELVLKEYRKRHEAAEKNRYSRNFWYEPGTRENNFEAWKSLFPIIDIRHDHNLTYSHWKQNRFRDKNNCQNWAETDDQIPGWGKTKKLIKKLN
jgi:hypothetical protein